jgi:predicted nucleotidyltransferase
MTSKPMTDIQQLIDEVVDRVRQVEGVCAVALGGSRAQGTHTEGSDIDVGIYYHPQRPMDLAALGEAAKAIDDEHRDDLVTDFGGWGPWMNGGGWLKVRGIALDFIYRDIQRVSEVVEACCAGKLEVGYQPTYTMGFASSIYMGEAAVCRVLWEADAPGMLSAIKGRTKPYPAALKQATLGRFGWEIDFSIAVAEKCVERAVRAQ